MFMLFYVLMFMLFVWCLCLMFMLFLLFWCLCCLMFMFVVLFDVYVVYVVCYFDVYVVLMFMLFWCVCFVVVLFDVLLLFCLMCMLLPAATPPLAAAAPPSHIKFDVWIWGVPAGSAGGRRGRGSGASLGRSGGVPGQSWDGLEAFLGPPWAPQKLLESC